MTTRSIWGSAVPPTLPVIETDGTPSIRLGSHFATTASGWTCTGAKIYIPATTQDAANGQIELFAYNNTTHPGTAPNSQTPTQTKTVTLPATITAGWVSVTWDTPFSVAANDNVYIGYQFKDAGHAGYYYYGGNTPTAAIAATDGSALSMVASGAPRSWYKIGSTDSSGGNLYGVDILMSDAAPKARVYKASYAGASTSPKARVFKAGFAGVNLNNPKARVYRAYYSGTSLPSVQPILNQKVEPGTLVSLVAVPASGPLDSYVWRQISGTTVVDTSTTGNTLSFTAPALMPPGDQLSFGVAGALSGVAGSEQVTNVIVNPQLDWSWNGSQFVPSNPIFIAPPTVNLYGFDTPPTTAAIDAAYGLGANAIRTGNAIWNMGSIQGSVSNPSWQPITAAVNSMVNAMTYARSKGMKVFMTNAQQCEVSGVNDLTSFIKVNTPYWLWLGQTFGGLVSGVQIWNEHDKTNFMNSTQAAPTTIAVGDGTTLPYVQAFARAMKAARTIFKSASTAAAQVPVYTTIYGYPVDDSMEAEWNTFYGDPSDPNSFAANVDLIGVNCYIDPGNLSAQMSTFAARLDRLSVKYNKPVGIFEFGFSNDSNSYANVGNWTAQVIQAISSTQPGHVLFASEYQLYDQDTSGGHEQSFGILKSDGTTKAGYTSVVSAQMIAAINKISLPTNSHTVYGETGIGSSVQKDGTPSIRLGSFYTTTANGWSCSGGRVYIPADQSLSGAQIEIFAYNSQASPNGTPPTSITPTYTKTLTLPTTVTAGWLTATWDIPFTVAPGDNVFIGYQFKSAGHAGYYMYAGNTPSTSIPAADGFALSEVAAATPRSWFRIGTTDNSGYNMYGTDIVLTLTPATGSYGIGKYGQSSYA